MSRIPSVLITLFLVSIILLDSPVASAQVAYTVEEIPPLPGETHVIPFGINARGHVVGGCGLYRAFVFSDGSGTSELLPSAGRPWALARAINDAGAVVGELWGGGLPYQAARWNGGSIDDVGVPGEASRAWNVAADGCIVGDSPVDALTTGAFMFTESDGASMIAPSRMNSHAYDINDAGRVTGTMTVGSFYHALRFTPGAGVEDLGATSSFPGSHGKSINISGQVAGTLYSSSGNSQRVFRYTDGVGIVQLGGVGQTNEPWGMNSRGDFVGRGQPTAGLLRAFLFTDGGGLQDLTLKIDPSLGLKLFYAYDINDAGQIVCLAYTSAGFWRGVRLSPVVPVGPMAAVSASPVKVSAGENCTVWVTISEPAPAGGALITLSSANPQILFAPSTVMIPEGSRHGSFVARPNPVSTSTSVTITAAYAGNARTTSIDVDPAAPTSVGGDTPALPMLRVFPISPNPAAHSARLEYELAIPMRVKVGVYDVNGRLVKMLIDAPQEASSQRIVWDLRDRVGFDMPSGAYFFRIQAGNHRHSAKLVVVR